MKTYQQFLLELGQPTTGVPPTSIPPAAVPQTTQPLQQTNPYAIPNVKEVVRDPTFLATLKLLQTVGLTRNTSVLRPLAAVVQNITNQLQSKQTQISTNPGGTPPATQNGVPGQG